MPTKTYTVKQVAQALGFSTNTVYKYLDEGKITATRLGREGRFRIPEVEVVRLLGDKGVPAPPPTPPPAPLTPTPQSNITFAILNQVAAPDFFDWFIALAAIFSGIAYFLYPPSVQLALLPPMHIALVVSGIALLAIDTFLGTHKQTHSLMGHLPVAISFLTISLLLFLARQPLTAAYFICFGLSSLIAFFNPHRPVVNFIAFLFLSIIAVGLAFSSSPLPIFSLDPRYFLTRHLSLFRFLTVLTGTSIAFLLWITHRRSRSLFLLLISLTGLIYLALSLNFATLQVWNQTILTLLIGCFALALPLHNRFQDLGGQFTRRHVLISSCWLIMVLLVGLSIILNVQHFFARLFFKTQRQNVAAAANLVQAYVMDGTSFVTYLSRHPQLPPLILAPSTSRLTDFTKEAFLSSTSLRRLSVTDSTGRIISAYPPFPSDQLVASIANQPYFQTARDLGQTIISQAAPPLLPSSPPTIYLASPVYDPKGQFTGSVIGSLDLPKLSDRLTSLQVENLGSFAIADKSKHLVLHPSPQLVGLVTTDIYLINAVDGQSGETTNYSETGSDLETFQPIPSLSWGISAQTPAALALRTSSFVSFFIFLITVGSGVSTLLVASYIIRLKSS